MITEPLKRSFCESSSAGQHVVHVVAEFYPWIKFYFPLFWGMVTCDNEFKTKAFKIRTKDKIELHHRYLHISGILPRGITITERQTTPNKIL